MKAVLMSIQPKWCELIASGKKTVEVRKTKPKLDVPFKVYIYCTQEKRLLHKFDKGERIDDEHFFEEHVFVRQNTWIRGHFNPNGKVIGEFVCDKVVEFENCMYEPEFHETSVLSCVDFEKLALYLGKNDFGYGWHISNLVIYDKPKELGEFAKPAQTTYDNEGYLLCDGCDFADWKTERVCTQNFCKERMLTRPPQSWCYVEGVN